MDACSLPSTFLPTLLSAQSLLVRNEQSVNSSLALFKL